MFKRKLLKAIAANWILHSGGAVCRLAHFEYSTKYGMATCHEVVIREKSGLEVVNADKFAVFVAESGSHKYIGFLSYNPPVLHGKTLVRLVHVV